MNGVDRVGAHAPARGWTARLLGRFHVTGAFWYRFHFWGVRRPRWLITLSVNLFTLGFFLALVRIRRAIWRNLEAVLGPAGPWTRNVRAFRTLHTFAWCLTERYENLAGAREISTRLEGGDRWQRVSDTTQGIIVVSAHLGNWELGSDLPSRLERRPVNVVREEELDPDAQQFIGKLIAERMDGLYTTHFANGNPKLGLELADALDRGEIVALQVDRPRAGGKTIEVSLFDRPFRLPAGPLVLARVAEVAIVPVFTVREGRLRYRVRVGEPIRVERTDDRRADLGRAADSLASAIETAIRETPYQWFCFGEVWPPN